MTYVCFRLHVFSEFVESNFGDASPSGPTLVTGAIHATVAIRQVNNLLQHNQCNHYVRNQRVDRSAPSEVQDILWLACRSSWDPARVPLYGRIQNRFIQTASSARDARAFLWRKGNYSRYYSGLAVPARRTNLCHRWPDLTCQSQMTVIASFARSPETY